MSSPPPIHIHTRNSIVLYSINYRKLIGDALLENESLREHDNSSPYLKEKRIRRICV